MVIVVDSSLGRGAGWRLWVYPQAGEASGAFRPSIPPQRAFVEAGKSRDARRSRQVAGGRARKKLRLYCAANRLNRLGTLTYRGEGCHSPAAIRADLGEFFRVVRDRLGGKAFPYAWVPEWHKSGHGLHAHFAVGQFIPQRLIRDAWGHGFVSIKLIGDLPVGSGPVEEARRAAGYLSKYVAKDFADDPTRDLGRHRYDVAEGFQPERFPVYGRSAAEALGQAAAFFGGPPAFQWSSADSPDWGGLPAVSATWRG